jgi:hypothetical protein
VDFVAVLDVASESAADAKEKENKRTINQRHINFM